MGFVWYERLTRKARSQQLITSAHCAEGTVIPELVFPATQGAVRELPIRARHHSLSRLKDANICMVRMSRIKLLRLPIWTTSIHVISTKAPSRLGAGARAPV